MKHQIIQLKQRHNLEYALKVVSAIDPNEDKPITVEIYEGTKEKPNTWPMKKLWRLWMAETATFMSGQGVTMPLYFKSSGEPYGSRPFNPQDAHELFVRHYIGLDANGERYKTASGERGKMVDMMTKHQIWCMEKGIRLTIPEESEFMKCKAAQEE